MKMLGKLARSLATRYVCQNCEKEKERRAVAHNATKCLERNSLLAESNQAASIEIHRLEKALAKAELERDVAREMQLARYPGYRDAYIRAYGRMIEERRSRGLPCDWQTGEDVLHWSLEDGELPGQMVLEGMEEDTL